MPHRYLDRMDQTHALDDLIKPFLEEHGFDVIEYGQTAILCDLSARAKLKRLLVRYYSIDDYAAGFMVKFAPDFVCFHRATGQPFFLDTKSSVIPMLFMNPVRELQEKARAKGIPVPKRYDIAPIEREAWDV